MARWLLLLVEFEINYTTLKAILNQDFADLVSQFPLGDYEPMNEVLLDEELEVACCAISEGWTLTFNGSSTIVGGGADVVLTAMDGRKRNLSYKLSFVCTNNEAEYEAFILRLLVARKAGIR